LIGALAIASCAIASSASATVIFADDFERPDSSVVGAPAAFPTDVALATYRRRKPAAIAV
jgi:hypothetical protein